MKFEKGNKIAKGGARKGAGRKPGSARDELQGILDEACPRESRLILFQGLVARAQAGDPKAAALVLAYIYGKPVERKEISGNDGDALKVIVEYVNSSPEPA